MSTEQDIRRVRDALLRRSTKLFQGIFLETHRRIVLRTPVDTGRARGNWMVSEGEPVTESDPSRFDKTGGAGMAEAKGLAKDLKFGDVAFIVNNLPYIEALENGHSKQAPAGMVAVTVTEMQPVCEQMVQQLERNG